MLFSFVPFASSSPNTKFDSPFTFTPVPLVIKLPFTIATVGYVVVSATVFPTSSIPSGLVR
jgi:hypothetical protein